MVVPALLGARGTMNANPARCATRRRSPKAAISVGVGELAASCSGTEVENGMRVGDGVTLHRVAVLRDVRCASRGPTLVPWTAAVPPAVEGAHPPDRTRRGSPAVSRIHAGRSSSVGTKTQGRVDAAALRQPEWQNQVGPGSSPGS